jgi:hypothetical protein
VCEAPAPAGIEFRLGAVGVKDCQAALGFGLGRDEVSEGLGLGEVEFAVEKGAAGKLAGLGVADAGDSGQRIQLSRNNCLAAVDLELGTVLAREGVRPAKE